MPLYEVEHEIGRIRQMKDLGIQRETIVTSVNDSLRTYLLERVQAPSAFELVAERPVAAEDLGTLRVLAQGYEHRGDGDLDNSFALSVQEAETDPVKERYELENAGYDEVKKQFFNYPVYSTVMLMSPPPDAPIPGYPGHNIALFYHILPHEKGEDFRNIKALAWVNKFTNEEQAALLTDLGAKNQVVATERSILLNPVVVPAGEESSDSYKLLWNKIGALYKKKERDFRYPHFERMEHRLLHGTSQWAKRESPLPDMTQALAERMVDTSDRSIDFHETDEWKIMVNVADMEEKGHTVARKAYADMPQAEKEVVVFQGYGHMAYMPKSVATGCGLDVFGGGESGNGQSYDADGFIAWNFTVENTGTATLPEVKKPTKWTKGGKCRQCFTANTEVGECSVCQSCQTLFDLGFLK